MAVNNKLTYILSCDGYGERQVSPLGESSFKMTWKRIDQDTNPRFGYDVAFDGSLQFTGADFGWLLDAENSGFRCSDMFIQLKTNQCPDIESEDGLVEIIEGAKITLSKGTWDLDGCKVTIPVISPDPYQCLNNKKGDKLNMFEAPGDPESVRLYDYVPTFEYNLTTLSGAPTNIDDQNFSHYPNKRAEYPGFGCEDEVTDPYWFESDTKLFDTDDLQNITVNPVTYEEIFHTGSTPYHSDFPTSSGAFDAVAVGWRLYYSDYDIRCIESATFGLHWVANYRWIREVKDVLTGTPMPDDWIFIGAGIGVDHYARQPILVPRKRVNKPSYIDNNPPASFPRHKIFLQLSNYIVGLDTVVSDPNDDNTGGTGLGNIYGIQALPNGRLLNKIITYAFGHCCPDLTVKSEFLQINPDTITDVNYVTGDLSFTNRLVLFQKSDVKRPWATEAATIGTFTTDELITWLLMQFRLKYCIFGNVIKIEHVMSDIFIKPATRDISGGKMVAGKRIYTYEIDGLVAKNTFSFQEARNQVAFLPDDDFAGVPILYYGSCVSREENKNVLDRHLSRVTNDVIFILVNSGGAETKMIDNGTANKYNVNDDVRKGVISDDGFCFVASKIGIDGNRYGMAYAGILSDKQPINNVMGWARLHESFYKVMANSETGNMNSTDVTFTSVKPIRKQVKLPFKLCCVAGFDPYEQITSQLGTGIITTAEWSPHDNIMRVELLFEP